VYPPCLAYVQYVQPIQLATLKKNLKKVVEKYHGSQTDGSLNSVMLKTNTCFTYKDYLGKYDDTIKLESHVFIGKTTKAYILFNYGNFSYTPFYGGLVEVGAVGVPLKWVAITRNNNDFGLEPRETALDSASKRVAVCKFLEDVKSFVGVRSTHVYIYAGLQVEVWTNCLFVFF